MRHRARLLLERAAWSWMGAVLLLVCSGIPPAFAAEGVVEITQLLVERQEDGVTLSAGVRFDLPSVVEDALDKGIPMYFVTEANVYRDRWYWYDKRVAAAVRHMRLTFQPLTRRWRLQVSPHPIVNSGLVLGQNFDTRDEALAALQRISGWRIAEPAEVDAAVPHSVEFRFRLDVSQLPRPFQIGAVGQSEWNITASTTVRLQPEARK